MTEPPKPKKAEMLEYVCLSCGSNGETWFRCVPDRDTTYITTKCPKCSNRAIQVSIWGITEFMRQVTKRLKSVEGDVFDMQAAQD
ncbi:hypothetical protein RXR48_28535, partial [Pseudomonas aeruginosa]|nr:hypothetical protein [Pseudomonas aeruginosa]